jgi:carbon-monoxide dehydrogenase medium subunit
MRAARSEEALVGKQLTDDVIDEAAKYAAEDCNPTEDLRGDEDYKRHLVKVVTKRMVKLALERAQNA